MDMLAACVRTRQSSSLLFRCYNLKVTVAYTHWRVHNNFKPVDTYSGFKKQENILVTSTTTYTCTIKHILLNTRKLISVNTVMIRDVVYMYRYVFLLLLFSPLSSLHRCVYNTSTHGPFIVRFIHLWRLYDYETSLWHSRAHCRRHCCRARGARTER